MKKESASTPALKIFIPFVVVLGICILVKTGYDFGQWLHDILR